MPCLFVVGAENGLSQPSETNWYPHWSMFFQNCVLLSLVGWYTVFKNESFAVLLVGAVTTPPATDSSRKKVNIWSLLSSEEWDADISCSRTEKQRKTGCYIVLHCAAGTFKCKSIVRCQNLNALLPAILPCSYMFSCHLKPSGCQKPLYKFRSGKISRVSFDYLLNQRIHVDITHCFDFQVQTWWEQTL